MHSAPLEGGALDGRSWHIAPTARHIATPSVATNTILIVNIIALLFLLLKALKVSYHATSSSPNLFWSIGVARAIAGDATS